MSIERKLIILEKVSKFYSKNGQINVGLNNISLSFSKGEFVAVTGASGSGKTTLSNVISGMDSYESGELYIDGYPTSHYSMEEMEQFSSQYISFVFQNYNIIDNFTVYQNIEIALKLAKYEEEKIQARTLELIEEVGLKDHAYHKASKLSGGQQQRLVIARALAKDSDIIIADEPTGNLDEENSMNIIRLLNEIAKYKCVIVVSHEYDELKDYVTRKIRLKDGRIVEDIQVRINEEKQEPSKPMTQTGLGFKEVFKIALRNVLTVPKVTIFTLTMMLFLLAGIMVGYGNYANVNYSGYVNPTEANNLGDASPGRLIVYKSDGSDFTEDEIIQIEGLDAVSDIITQGNLLYEKEIYLYPYNEGSQANYELYSKLNIASASMITEDLLVDGRLPMASNEILVTYDESFDTVNNIGDHVFISDEDATTGEHSFTDSMIIVGYVKPLAVNDTTNRLYLTTEYIESKAVQLNLKNDQIFLSHEIQLSQIVNVSRFLDGDSHVNFVVNYAYQEGQLKISQNIIDEFIKTMTELPEGYTIDSANQRLKEGTFYIQRRSEYVDNELIELELQFVDTTENQIILSQVDYDKLFGQSANNQINIITSDYKNGIDIKTELENLGFLVTYPFETLDRIEIETQQTTVAVIFIASALLLTGVTWLVLSLIQKTKEKRYIILRSMGAKKQVVKSLSLLELMIIGFISFIIITVTIILSKVMNMGYLTNIFVYITWIELLLLFVLMNAIILIINRNIGKTIFNESINTSLRGL